MGEEREQVITEMIELVHQVDEKVQKIAAHNRKIKKSKQSKVRRALRKALKR